MNFDALPHILRVQLRNNAFFSTRHQLLYIATPKVSCTSLKWWFSDLTGVMERVSKATSSRESESDLFIHDVLSIVAPQITGANEEGLHRAVTTPDYFKFCLTRNPYVRAFSAWQSKWLLSESLQKNTYCYTQADQKLVSIEDIRLEFERFLEVVSITPDFQQDVHMATQTSLIDPKVIPYTIVSQIEDTRELVDALSEHLGPEFKDPFKFLRVNVSLLSYSASWLSHRSIKLIQQIYAQDFDLFGYSTEVPVGAGKPSEDSVALAMRSIKLLRRRNERIGQLLSISIGLDTLKNSPVNAPGAKALNYHSNFAADFEQTTTLIIDKIANYKGLLQHKDEQMLLLRRELNHAESQLDLLKDLLLNRD
jgi:hypothetical protein